MKNIGQLIIALIIFTNLSFAEKNNSSDLALELIDNICGDSWCEGDFNFEFLHFELNTKTSTATVGLVLINEWYQGLRRLKATCKIKNINSMDQVIQYYRGRPELTNNFYEELGLCISDKEEKFREILGDSKTNN